MAATRQILLFDATSEAGLYHDPERFGFFSILYRDTHRTEQHSYRLPLMAEVIRLLPKDRDTWISQAEFVAPNRRIINLACLTSLFIDVDCYKVGIDPQRAEALLLLRCEDDGMPMPSIIISSGRGLQVKWLLDKPLARQALPRWNAAQRALVEKFLDIGADPAAKDASRVLRLVETVNTKSGEVVHVSWANTIKDGAEVRAYDFDYLCEYLLPFTREQLAQMREERRKKYENRQQRPKLEIIDGNSQAKRGFSSRQLAWHRLEDLRTLFRIRHGKIEGQSMPLLFWSLNFLLLSGATNPAQMYHEASALCQEFGLGEFKRKGELSTLYAKAKQFEAGETVTHNGRSYPALYTPRNSTLIDLFSITPDEQRQLRTVIGEDESKNRDRLQAEKRRRAAGAVTRETYLTENDQKRIEARRLAAGGMSQRAIAATLGVPQSTIAGWLRHE
jgi:hypothetical protein